MTKNILRKLLYINLKIIKYSQEHFYKENESVNEPVLLVQVFMIFGY